MSTATYTIDATSRRIFVFAHTNGVDQQDLRSEWTKLRTLPSTWRTAVIAVTISIGLGAILCVSQANQWATMTAAQRATFDPTACSLGGFFLVGAVLLGALAVRTVTAEYSTGMIRSTFTATPTRRLVLTTKAAVTAAFAFPVGSGGCVVSFEVGQRIFAGKHLQVSFGHPGVLQALVLRCRRRQPRRNHRCRTRRPHPAHRGRDHCSGVGHRRRGSARPVSSGRPSPVPAWDRTRGRRDGQPLGGTPEARYCPRGPRHLCRHRLG